MTSLESEGPRGTAQYGAARELRLEPLTHMKRVGVTLDATIWSSSSNNPQFRLCGDLPASREGVFLFELDVMGISSSGSPVLHFDFGHGYQEQDSVVVGRNVVSAKSHSAVIELAAVPRSIRLDPCSSPGEFLCCDVRVSALERDHVPHARLPRSSLGKQSRRPGPAGAAIPQPPPIRVAAILHLFYYDLWAEMADHIGRIPFLDRLYVSIPDSAPPNFEDEILAPFPFALVRRVPNRGRDILPFLQWLEVAALHDIDLVCKLHTKRSPHLSTGEAWRQDMLAKLLHSKQAIEEIIAAFEDDPTLGIVAPGGHVVPSSYFWERNAPRVEQLCDRMGRNVHGTRFEYVAGSIFWARVQALLPLRRMSLRDEDFETEQGMMDGTLAHALERCFPVAASYAGYRLAETANPAGTTVHDFAPPPPAVHRTYHDWLDQFEIPLDRYTDLARSHGEWDDPPLISLLMPTFETRKEDLIAAIESVLAQVYPRWELCIADDASKQPHVREVLEGYLRREPRIKVLYRQANGHISAASNSALELATGSFVGLVDHDDLLHPLALHFVAQAIVCNRGCQLVYTDEDKIGEDGRRQDPYFKCALNYELLLAHNMVCHLACYRAERLRLIGGFREGVEGAQDYDLVLRFLEGIDRSRVIHVPRVLYHWRIGSGSTALAGDEKPYAQIAARKAIWEHLGRTGHAARVVPAPECPTMNRVRFQVAKPEPSVAIVIPARDRAEPLALCVDSIRSRSSYPNYSIVIVDNGSREEATFALFARLEKVGVRILRDEADLDFSALNNRAVKAVSADFVCLMRDDIEIESTDWLEEMVGMADRPGVGAVGARLWYPDRRLQHGGVILGIGGVAGHSHRYLPKGAAGYFSRAALHQELSAVVTAGMLIRRKIYEEVGGLDESLRTAFQDVDFCLRVRAAGYRNVWTPYAEMIHHESPSRGHETAPQEQSRLSDEIRLMRARWGEALANDPAYSPNLTLEREDFGLAWPPRVELAIPARAAGAVPSIPAP